MTEEEIPQTRYDGPHDTCPLGVAHEHTLKRVIDGYVLGEVVVTEQVARSLAAMLDGQSVEGKRFAARNLRNATEEWAHDALAAALDREDDAFTAGLIISALGNQKRREGVEHIEKWVARADEAFVAANIMASYIQLWTETGCAKDRLDPSCEKIERTIAAFAQSPDPITAHEARRLADIIASREPE